MGCVLWVSLAFAQVPHLIRYQGQAVDSQGVPLEGPYTLTFRLYDAQTAGTKVWEEIQANVALQGGHFSVLLGQVTPLTAMDWSQPRWLSVQVGSDPELAPRQRITSVPMAIMAERLANSEAISSVNLLMDGSFEEWTGQQYPLLVNWQTTATVSTWILVKKATDQVRYGQTAAKLIHDGMGHHGNLTQRVDAVSSLRGQLVTFSFWALSRQSNQPCAAVSDGVSSSTSCSHTGDGTWQRLTVTHPVSSQVAYVDFTIRQTRDGEDPNSDQANHVDGAIAVTGPIPFAFSPHPQDGQDINARVFNSTGISSPHNSETVLTFDSERWDTDGIHDTVSNTSRLTAKTSGKYLIFGHVVWAGTGGGSRRIAIRLNGTFDLATESRISAGSDDGRQTIATYYNLVAGDYVELVVFQSSGQPLNVLAERNDSPELGMVKLP